MVRFDDDIDDDFDDEDENDDEDEDGDEEEEGDEEEPETWQVSVTGRFPLKAGSA